MKARRFWLIRFWGFLLVLSGLVLTTSLQAQTKSAYPKNGDGITTFLKRYGYSGTASQREFIELNKGKFGKNNSLILGVRYKLPVKGESSSKDTTQGSSGKRRPNYEPLFGKSLAKYNVTSSDLKGACFYLVSGHGGPDPGAIGKMGSHSLHEDEYAYDIMLRLARNLLMRGAKVHIIIQDAKDGIRDQQFLNNSKRETCMGATIPFNQVSRLEQRSAKINALSQKDKESYKRAIFIHVDSRSKHKRTDVYFYYQDNSSASKRLARTMRSTFKSKYNRHQPGRGFSGTVESRNLYVLRHTRPASVFVELGNIQNSYDQQRIILSNNRQALANWLCEGFMADFKASKKSGK